MTPADIIRSHKLGEDFDINGVTYRIVLLHTHGPIEDFCDKCPAGGLLKCRAGDYYACRPRPRPPDGARFVVPVSEVPLLAMKGIMV